MKRSTAGIVVILLAFIGVFKVNAQSPETIWLAGGVTSFKTNETVLVTLNASSSTLIQGFTFQIRYDPACLLPVNASSPISGMNGLPLPQVTGLVDGSYASTTPQPINGVLAEVRFTALKGCQTTLTLESAALAIRSAEGFAAPLTSVLVGERNISLNIDSEVGVSQSAQPVGGSVLPLDPPAAEGGFAGWIIGGLIILLFGGVGLGAYKFFRIGATD